MGEQASPSMAAVQHSCGLAADVRHPPGSEPLHKTQAPRWINRLRDFFMSGRRKMADPGTGEQEEPPMSGFIVDASVSAAWFLPDEATPFTEAALQATIDRPVWVPQLWRLERQPAAQRPAQSTHHRGQAPRTGGVGAGAAAAGRQLAGGDDRDRRTGLRPRPERYDAAYLELALRRALPLASLEASLIG